MVTTETRRRAIHAPATAGRTPAHPVKLVGLRHDSRLRDAAPLIVSRRDQDFVEGLLADLGDERRRAGLVRSALEASPSLRLFQPLQRVFNLVVLEAFCDVPGQHCTNRQRIESSGFVLRRVEGARKLAWLKSGTRVFGWEAVDEEVDPAHDRRPSTVSLGHPVLNERAPSQQARRTAGSLRLARSSEPVGEDVQPLFLAPPDVCSVAGKTLLFGTLAVTSSEVTEMPNKPPVYGKDPAEQALLRAHMHDWLKRGGARPFELAGQTISTEQITAASRTGSTAYQTLGPLTQLLRQLHVEFDAFGEGGASDALNKALGGMRVETDVPARYDRPKSVEVRDARSFLDEAKAVLLDATPGAAVLLPDRWAAVSNDAAEKVFAASLECLSARHAKLLPAAGRFDAPPGVAEPRYVVRAFVRLKPEQPGCPGRLVWSSYSPEFTIAPWFESSGAPVPIIPMPDLFDRAALARVKPSVAFAVPAKLANLLTRDPKKLRDGEGDSGGGGLDWICSFSLPIISLCAFIVLNIFLQLLNLIFFWLPFLKICIPVPKEK